MGGWAGLRSTEWLKQRWFHKNIKAFEPRSKHSKADNGIGTQKVGNL